MPANVTIDQPTDVAFQVSRIAESLFEQDDLAHVLIVVREGRITVGQWQPDTHTALVMLRQATSPASCHSDNHQPQANPKSAHHEQLGNRVHACLRELREFGVEFIFAWKIGEGIARLDSMTGPSTPISIQDVMTALERNCRLTGEYPRIGAKMASLHVAG